MLAAKIIVALVGLVLAGRYLLRPAFRAIAASGNQEIMTAMASARRRRHLGADGKGGAVGLAWRFPVGRAACRVGVSP